MCYKAHCEMAWSNATLEGFALAATIAKDRAARQAAPGIVAREARRVCEPARRLMEQPAAIRRREITRIADALAHRPSRQARACARALALLASDVPRAVGQRWLDQAPPVRTGFVPDPGLRAVVRRAVAMIGGAEQARQGERWDG